MWRRDRRSSPPSPPPQHNNTPLPSGVRVFALWYHHPALPCGPRPTLVPPCHPSLPPSFLTREFAGGRVVRAVPRVVVVGAIHGAIIAVGGGAGHAVLGTGH